MRQKPTAPRKQRTGDERDFHNREDIPPPFPPSSNGTVLRMGGRETKLQQTGREKRETPKITTEKNNRTMTMTTGGEVGEATGGQQTTGSFRFLSRTQRRIRACRQGH